jgi:Tol biopolymer transport system component
MTNAPDRLISEWLADGPEQGPGHSLERALAATRRTPQRPGWTFPGRWLPAQLTLSPAALPRPLVMLVAVALLAAALTVVLVIAGSRRPAPPFGLAGNGVILLDLDARLWRVQADGSNPQPFEIWNLGRVYSPVFSPDGLHLAYLTQPVGRGPMSVFVANADGTDARNVTGDMHVIAAPLDAVAWSPDSRRLAFASSVAQTFVVYVVGADGSGLRAVTNADATRRYPSWSPDGRWLAYRLDRDDASGRRHLAIIPADGGPERVLVSVDTADSSFSASQWAGDSQRIAYSRKGGGTYIVGISDLDGNETLVSRPEENADVAIWSPDGSRLVYPIASDGAVVVALDHPESRLSIPEGLTECGVAWAPDATALLGLGRQCTELFRIPLADPASAVPIAIPSGLITFANWQRTPP